MPDNEDDPALDPNTPMGGAVAAGLLRRQADGSYIAYNSPMPDDTPAPPDLAAIRADCATLKPRERASTLTDAQERLLYEAVPALLAEVARIAALERALEHATLVIEQYEMDIRNSDWTGVNLAAVGFCQGVIYRRALRTVQQLARATPPAATGE